MRGWTFLTFLLLFGCRREGVTHYQAMKPGPMPEAAPMAAGSGPMGAGNAPMGAPADISPPPAPVGGALRWTLPRGWSQNAAAGAMRYATLKAPVPGRVDVSVVVLPGPAGGELANVNRWRGQLGLGPLDEAAMAAARKPVKSPAGAISLYDFAGKSGRMIAGLTVLNGSTWFVKMAGDDAPVTAARSDFLRLLESLHVDSQD